MQAVLPQEFRESEHSSRTDDLQSRRGHSAGDEGAVFPAKFGGGGGEKSGEGLLSLQAEVLDDDSGYQFVVLFSGTAMGVVSAGKAA